MEISQIELARLLLYCFVLGGGIGIVYDMLRSLRDLFFGGAEACRIKRLCAIKLPFCKKPLAGDKKMKRSERVATELIDFFCAVAAGIGIIVLSYAYNKGRIRAFCVPGLLSGYAFSRLVLGRILAPVFETVALLIKYFFSSIIALLCIPIRKIYKNMNKSVKKITSLFILTLEKKRKKLYNIKEEVYSRNDEEKNTKRWRVINVKRSERKRGEEDDGKEQK